MSINCQIIFDNNPYGVYYSGQVLSGRVELSLSKVKKVRGISLNIQGYAKTSWTESHSRSNTVLRNRTRTMYTVTYSGREDYISSTTYLAGSASSNNFDLLPGVYTYAFSCVLPTQAPSSFEGTFGHVRYTAKVILDRPWKFDQTYTIGFTVIKGIDLNYEPTLRIPAQVEKVKVFWCGLCSSYPLRIILKMPTTGFVPGQLIPISAEIINTSRMDVKEINVSLRKIVNYSSQVPRTKYKQEIKIVAHNRLGDVKAGATTTHNCHLRIPAVPPSSKTFCGIIQIDYDVYVQAKVGGMHISPAVSYPITVGTVPLVDIVHHQPTTSYQMQEPISKVEIDPNGSTSVEKNGVNTVSQRVPSHVSVMGDVAPPSYEEAVLNSKTRMGDEEDHAFQVDDYIPRYPVFHSLDELSAPLPSSA